MSQISSSAALRRAATISLLALSTALAACGSSEEPASKGAETKTTPPSKPVGMPTPDGDATKVSAALTKAGIKHEKSDLEQGGGILLAGLFRVFVYADVATAKQREAQLKKSFSRQDADELIDRHGAALVFSPSGVEPTKKQRQQFAEISEAIASAS